MKLTKKIALFGTTALLLIACGTDDVGTEGVEETTEPDTEEVAETGEDSVLTEEELTELQEGVEEYLNDLDYDVSLDRFELDGEWLNVWTDLQEDPLPTTEEMEGILAGVSWYLADLNDVTDTEFSITSRLITRVNGDDIMAWLIDTYTQGEYEMEEGEHFDILP